MKLKRRIMKKRGNRQILKSSQKREIILRKGLDKIIVKQHFKDPNR